MPETPSTDASPSADTTPSLWRRIRRGVLALLAPLMHRSHTLLYYTPPRMSLPDTPDPPQWESFRFDNKLAICHRDTSRGGVKRGASDFLFYPFGECIISDEFVDVGEMV